MKQKKKQGALMGQSMNPKKRSSFTRRALRVNSKILGSYASRLLLRQSYFLYYINKDKK
jgi:hypothetical protein